MANFHANIHANLAYGHTGYEKDVISYFRSAFIEVRKTAENAARRLWVEF